MGQQCPCKACVDAGVAAERVCIIARLRAEADTLDSRREAERRLLANSAWVALVWRASELRRMADLLESEGAK